jgi:hypothetical protein
MKWLILQVRLDYRELLHRPKNNSVRFTTVRLAERGVRFVYYDVVGDFADLSNLCGRSISEVQVLSCCRTK